MHRSGITDLSRKGKKTTNNKKKNLLLCFGWRSKQQQVFTHALFTKENGTRPQKSHVLMERPNSQRSGGTRCCTRYSQLKAGGNSDQPQVFLCVICTWCHSKCCLRVDARRPAWAPLCWCELGSWTVTHQHGSKWLLLRPSRLNVGPIDSSNLPLKAAMCNSKVIKSSLHLCRPEG